MNDAPLLYLRRCNGWPREGRLITRDDLETVLAVVCAAPGVTALGDFDTGLSVQIPAGRPWEVELPGTVARTFTYEPVPAGQHRAPAVMVDADGAV